MLRRHFLSPAPLDSCNLQHQNPKATARKPWPVYQSASIFAGSRTNQASQHRRSYSLPRSGGLSTFAFGSPPRPKIQAVSCIFPLDVDGGSMEEQGGHRQHAHCSVSQTTSCRFPVLIGPLRAPRRQSGSRQASARRGSVSGAPSGTTGSTLAHQTPSMPLTKAMCLPTRQTAPWSWKRAEW